MTKSGRLFAIGHVAFWLAMAAAAYAKAGAYTFASCWGIILVYMPPLPLILFGCAIAALLVLVNGAFDPMVRHSRAYLAATNVAVLTGGLIGVLSAGGVGGPYSCL